MQYLVEQGSSHREVLEKVRARYGESAQVLSHRTVRSGGFMGFFAREGVEITFYLKDDAVREGEKKKADIEEEKRKLLDRVSQERAIQEVLTEVRSLKVSIAESAARPAPADGEHPTLASLDAILADNDFSQWYRTELLARARAEFSLDALDDYEAVEESILEWIGDTVRIPVTPRPVKPRVLVLVGPTGVGKTTTIAKLAALHSLGIGGLPAGSVRMLTIDSYRIGAVEQIEKYAGIMRVPVSVVEKRVIGATLGAESVSRSISAGLIGLSVVAVFMIAKYGWLGLMADMALLLYGLLNFALYRFIPITLTLPGIAGFILSIGMAVDSNILIFERFREEKRMGKPWRIAMELGFGKAWDSIRDANFTTLITCAILFNPGNWSFLPSSGLVRGFAVTLFIGVVTSLFTGIVATRTFIRVLYKEHDSIQ